MRKVNDERWKKYALQSTPLMLEDVITGELLWGATKSVVATTAMMLVLSPLGFFSYPQGLFILPLAMVGGLLFSSVGMIATSLVPSIEGFNLPVFLVIFPMFVFSGTFFPIENLPRVVRMIALGLPLTHLSRMVRAAALGRLEASDGATALILLALALELALLAIAGMKRRLIK